MNPPTLKTTYSLPEIDALSRPPLPKKKPKQTNKEMSTFGIISDSEIDRVHGNANFGDSLSKRDIVNQALLKAACGYHQGSTARRILLDHKLVNEEYVLTAKGREYLWQTFKLPNSL